MNYRIFDQYLERWWRDASNAKTESLIKLLQNRELEIIDEVHYLSGTIRVIDEEGTPAKPGDIPVVEICKLGPLPGDEWGFTAFSLIENMVMVSSYTRCTVSGYNTPWNNWNCTFNKN